MADIDTTPGSGSWCAPDRPVEDYDEWLRSRFRSDIAVRQYLGVAAHILRRDPDNPLEISGPYAENLAAAIQRIAELR